MQPGDAGTPKSAHRAPLSYESHLLFLAPGTVLKLYLAKSYSLDSAMPGISYSTLSLWDRSCCGLQLRFFLLRFSSLLSLERVRIHHNLRNRSTVDETPGTYPNGVGWIMLLGTPPYSWHHRACVAVERLSRRQILAHKERGSSTSVQPRTVLQHMSVPIFTPIS